MSWIPVTNTTELSLKSAREYTITSNGRSLEIFIIHVGQGYFAYLNHCPHTGVNLNWMPEQFFDFSEQFIQCSTHGALFRFDDGYCVRGPCAGAKLAPVPLKISDGNIYVQVE